MIKGKKIAIDARMIEMSGIGTYIRHLMAQEIYDVALGDEEVIRKYDVHVRVISFTDGIYSPMQHVRFPYKALKKENVCLVHFPHYNVPFFYRRRYVVTVHDLIHMVFPEYLGGRFRYMYARLMIQNALKNAGMVFTDSEYSKLDIGRYFGIADDKVRVIPCGVGEEFRHKEPGEYDYIYDRYGIDRAKKSILYVGNLKRHKNLKTLLRAYASMPEHDKVNLIIVGKAFTGTDIPEDIDTAGIRESTIVTGKVPQEELVDFYNLADVFVFPSLYEGFGLPPLEAMACGTPVICSNAASLPEVAGDAALMIDPTDVAGLSSAMQKLLSDRALYEKMAEKGINRSRQFVWSTTADEVRQGICDEIQKQKY